MDARADGQALERLRALELVTDRVQEPALADDPLDAGGVGREPRINSVRPMVRATSGASNGAAQYIVSRWTRPSRSSMRSTTR